MFERGPFFRGKRTRHNWEQLTIWPQSFSLGIMIYSYEFRFMNCWLLCFELKTDQQLNNCTGQISNPAKLFVTRAHDSEDLINPRRNKPEIPGWDQTLGGPIAQVQKYLLRQYVQQSIQILLNSIPKSFFFRLMLVLFEKLAGMFLKIFQIFGRV